MTTATIDWRPLGEGHPPPPLKTPLLLWLPVEMLGCHVHGATFAMTANDRLMCIIGGRFGHDLPVPPTHWALAPGDPALMRTLPEFYGCGICDHMHRAGWDGDCRVDAERFHIEDVDALHGAEGWIEVDTPSGRIK